MDIITKTKEIADDLSIEEREELAEEMVRQLGPKMGGHFVLVLKGKGGRTGKVIRGEK